MFLKELMNSALVLNPKVKWISYHGSYDFAYILKFVMNNDDKLPETEKRISRYLKIICS